jgi:aspartate/methionine/tyrosine aminotransferase
MQVGAKLVPVQLQPPNWSIPEEQLRAAFTDKTKFILVNTPHNPTGKVGGVRIGTAHLVREWLCAASCSLKPLAITNSSAPQAR